MYFHVKRSGVLTLLRLAALGAVVLVGCSNETNGPATVAPGTENFAVAIAHGSTSQIINGQAELCLGVQDADNAPGALLESQKCSANAHQQWQLARDEAGYISIMSVGSGLCISLTGSADHSRATLHQSPCTTHDEQKWNLFGQGHGAFAIISKLTGLAIDLSGSDPHKHAELVEWAWGQNDRQHWTLPQATMESDLTSGPTDGSVITLAGAAAGNCIGVKDASPRDGAKLQSQGCSNSPFQQWRAEVDAEGAYALVNVGSGLCMDLTDASLAGAATIQQWTCSEVDWQKWEFHESTSGHYSVRSWYSGQALDVLGGGSIADAAIIQWEYWGGENQQWVITPGRGSRAEGAARATSLAATSTAPLAQTSSPSS